MVGNGLGDTAGSAVDAGGMVGSATVGSELGTSTVVGGAGGTVVGGGTDVGDGVDGDAGAQAVIKTTARMNAISR